MPEPTFAEFHQLALEIEWVPGSGTFARVCAMDGITVNRTKQIDENEVPADCDDESLPHNVRRNTRSRSWSISGTGFWSQQNHGNLLDWFNGVPAEKLNVRIFHANAAVGTPEYEEGVAILSELTNERTKGQQVSAQITLQVDGVLTSADKAA